MNKKKRVMVIGHEASLSGAPVLLLNLFRLLIEKELVNVQFVIRRDGPLAKEYKKLAPVVVLKAQDYGHEKNIFLKIRNFITNKINLVIILFRAFFCDYFFCNTTVNGKLLRWFYFHRKPVVTYVHELEKVIDFYLKQGDAVLPLSVAQVIAYPSAATKQMLHTKYNIPDQKLKKLLYYFPFTENQYNSKKAFEKKRLFREKSGFSENDFLVGTMGTISERKGIEMYIDVCKKTVSINPLIKFVWIGAFESNEQEVELRNSIQKNQLAKNLIFTGPLEYDIYNFSPFDIFFLSSREDTYPLVVLEAAMMKVPTICFSDSGGIVEFINNDAGWMIDDFSTIQAANKIIQLQRMKNIVQLQGESAFNKVLRLHCNANIILDQYRSVIEALN